MISPNLMVTDMARSVTFYRSVVGLTLTMTVNGDQSFAQGDAADPSAPNVVFATLEDGTGSPLMLQTVASFAADLPGEVAPGHVPARGGAVYMRGIDPDAVQSRIDAASIIAGPIDQWYGMRELYVRDPDGHILTLGAPMAAAPASIAEV